MLQVPWQAQARTGLAILSELLADLARLGECLSSLLHHLTCAQHRFLSGLCLAGVAQQGLLLKDPQHGGHPAQARCPNH